MNKIESKESCRRLARAIASDISLYEEKHVQQVKRGAPMPPELEQAIAQGRELYRSRTPPELANLYEESLLSVAGIAVNPPTAVAETGVPDPPRPPIHADAEAEAEAEAAPAPIQHDRRPAYEETSMFKTVVLLLLAAMAVALVGYVLVFR